MLSAEQCAISPFDHGLLTGDGVFETLIAHRGVAFAETRHYRRLMRSAAAFGLEVPSQKALSQAIRDVLEANELSSGVARVRITITGGASPLGSDRGSAEHTALVAASPSPTFDAPVAVVTVPFVRNEQGALAGLKTTSYGENVIALNYARERGAAEAIFGNTRGHLCEGSASNVFLVIEGDLVTPPLSSGCLAGVTRAVLLEICEREGVSVEERDLDLGRLVAAEEAFLTSSLRSVLGIASVDGVALGKAPGPLTLRLAEAFQQHAAALADP